MTQDEAFLRAIAENMDDDAPRLIYADYLDEQGQGERAEFIRLQCRIAAIEGTCSCGRCVRKRGGGQHTNGPCAVDQERHVIDAEGQTRQAFLRRREKDLWLAGRAYWGAKLPSALGDATNEFSWWRRGFIESVTVSCHDWLTHGPRIMEAVPTIREVRLSDYPPADLVVANDGGRVVWVYRRGHRSWPTEFDDAVNMTHASEADAIAVMSRCCLDYARAELVGFARG